MIYTCITISDPDLLAEIVEYRKSILAVTDRELGFTVVHLQGSPRNNLVCRQRECNLGNLICEAVVSYFVSNFTDNEWNDLAMAAYNAGGIRDSIRRGQLMFSFQEYNYNGNGSNEDGKIANY